ncbi:MAG: sulfotransferase, partial [Acidimicrobiia bacterium]|nr:sulfotransferase [Acidimicrobiia bacterium]
ARTSYKTSNPEWYRDYWIDRIGRLLDSSLRDRHLLPPDRTVDVFFHEYMADELGTMQRIYDAAGIKFTEAAKAEVAAYQAAHPRGKEGRVVYDLRGDFGITPEEVRSRFTNYMKTFPVQIEVK